MSDSPKNCLFCRIIAGEIPARKAYEDEMVVAFHDVNPQAPRHILICPREHVPTLDDLRPEHESVAGRAIRVAAELARQGGDAASGYRVVINCREGAGQSVFHLHIHVLGGRTFGWPPG